MMGNIDVLQVCFGAPKQRIECFMNGAGCCARIFKYKKRANGIQ